MAERLFFRIKNAKVLPVAMVILASHQLNSRWRTERLSVRVCEPNSLGRHSIEIGCAIGSATIATNAFDPDIVGHDQQDVGARG